MKIFIILSLLFFKTICGANLHENRQLLLDFHKTIGDLRTEIVNLKEELYNIRGNHGVNNTEKRSTLPKEPDVIDMNCTALTNEAEYLSQNFKTLSDDVKEFNSYVGKQLANYTSKNRKVEETGLKFTDLSLYRKVCDVKKSNGEWTVIQRRMDGSVNFYRGWADYKVGFGTYTGEFFIGLDNLHMLTTCAPQELIIEMEDYQNEKRYAQYDLFLIGDESEKYKMKELGNYKGDAGDSLRDHKSEMFTTFDQDNDSDSRNCAKEYKGAWWYSYCHKSNLNGEYGNNKYGEGVIWFHWHGHNYSLKKVEMKIRPYVGKQLANYASKHTKVEGSECVSNQPKFIILPQSQFVDKTLYEKVCDVKKSNGDWTVIQRRMDGSVNFYRGWADYKVGFGNITGEFFIGLDNLHLLTTCTPQELLIEMEDQANVKQYAKYDLFVIGDESEKYKMKELGKYEGNAGDSLSEHVLQKFTTFDQDNDIHDMLNCARRSRGAWWYNKCHHSNLNGEYGNTKYGEGINWLTFHMQQYSLKKVEMKIRPKN